VNGGLQGQRTELSWLRTTLSSWAVAVLTARMAFPVGVLVLTGPVAVTVIAHRRRRRLKRTGTPAALDRGTAILMAVACAAIALSAGLILF
jgi:hypothetical protein